MNYRIFLMLALFGAAAAQANPIEAPNQASIMGSETSVKCSAASDDLDTIMQNADHGARYKFDSSTIIGRMNIDAYNFALQNKDDAARQQFITQALSNCIVESNKFATAKIE